MRTWMLSIWLALFALPTFSQQTIFLPGGGGAGGGVTDHGALTGLADDDHAGYGFITSSASDATGACTPGDWHVNTSSKLVQLCSGNGAWDYAFGASATVGALYVYSTFADASNYDGLAIIADSAGGYVQFLANTAGSGTDNMAFKLQPVGTGDIEICQSDDGNICMLLDPDALSADRLLSFPDSDLTFGAYSPTLLNVTDEAAFKVAVNLEIGTDVESATSDDFDPDRNACDSTDDNLLDQECIEGFGSSPTPALSLTDSDTDDEDVSMRLSANATATGTGVEDVDVTLQSQVVGTDTPSLRVDASEKTVELGGAVLAGQVNLKASADGLNDDDWSGIVLNGWNCGEAVSQWDTVYLDDTANEWLQADADAAGEFPARGVAVAACTDGNPGIVLVQGVVRNDGWAWTANGATLFLSDTVAGITQTAPSTSGDCVQVVGFTLDDDTAYLNFSGHYLEVQ